jgi:hypothetical protein
VESSRFSCDFFTLCQAQRQPLRWGAVLIEPNRKVKLIFRDFCQIVFRLPTGQLWHTDCSVFRVVAKAAKALQHCQVNAASGRINVIRFQQIRQNSGKPASAAAAVSLDNRASILFANRLCHFPISRLPCLRDNYSENSLGRKRDLAVFCTYIFFAKTY